MLRETLKPLHHLFKGSFFDGYNFHIGVVLDCYKLLSLQ
ncbi:hypothetical protein M070_1778 [Bacteroides fragilis str. A7 (UDC12-2)]|nr:hypothetical protein M070_1778 [Bacteroides fragilis str. A7 (UDC12-2)]